MKAPPIIACEHLATGYPGVLLMRDVSFTIQRGEIVFILGSSGCGKSTLLKHLIGQIPPLGGTIRILGKETTYIEGDAREQMLLWTLC